jgi:integration host factor subunit beta
MAIIKDLVERISSKINYLPEEDILLATNLVFDYLKSELAKQNRIEIRGFGSFSIRKRKFANKKETYNTIYYRMPKKNKI